MERKPAASASVTNPFNKYMLDYRVGSTMSSTEILSIAVLLLLAALMGFPFPASLTFFLCFSRSRSRSRKGVCIRARIEEEDILQICGNGNDDEMNLPSDFTVP